MATSIEGKIIINPQFACISIKRDRFSQTKYMINAMVTLRRGKFIINATYKDACISRRSMGGHFRK
jgi:hypothetical protein